MLQCLYALNEIRCNVSIQVELDDDVSIQVELDDNDSI